MKSINRSVVLCMADGENLGGGLDLGAMNVGSPAVEIGVGDLTSMLDSVDLTTVDTERPILKPGLYNVTIDKFEVKPNKAQDGSNLNIHLKLKDAAESDAGKRVNAGFIIFDLISLVKTELYNPLEKLAQLQLGALGTKKKGFTVAELLGRTVTIRLVKKSSEEFGDQMRVAKYLKQTDPTVGQGGSGSVSLTSI